VCYASILVRYATHFPGLAVVQGSLLSYASLTAGQLWDNLANLVSLTEEFCPRHPDYVKEVILNNPYHKALSAIPSYCALLIGW